MTYRHMLITLALATMLTTAAVAQDPFFPVGTETLINAETAAEQNDAEIAVRPDGFVVTWESLGQDGSDDGVFFRLIDTNGMPVGDDFQVNTTTVGAQGDPDVATRSDGSFIIVWDSSGGQDGAGRGVFGRLFDSSGVPVSGEIAINQDTLGDQNDGVVAVQQDGSFIVVWESGVGDAAGYDIVGRLFNSAGAPETNDFQVNTHTPSDQEDIAIGVDGNDGFVVVWESDDQDFSYEAIAGQRLASDGSLVGDEFQVNTYTADRQANPGLAVNSVGGFVVVWEDYFQDILGVTTFGRVYDGSDNPVATTMTEFQVDMYPGTTQAYPQPAFTDDDTFVVVWESENQDGSSYGIFRNTFDTAGNALGTDTLVNTFTTGPQQEPKIAVGDDYALVVWADFGCCGDLYGQAFSLTTIFADGFESGDTSGWSSTSP